MKDETKEKLRVKALGRIPWNKGLSKETDVRLAEQGKNTSKTKRRRFAEGKLHIWNEGLKCPWSEERKQIRKEKYGDPEFRKSQRQKTLKYFSEHPEVREQRRQENLGKKDSKQTRLKKKKASKEMWKQRTPEEIIELYKKIGDGNRGKVRTEEYKKSVSDWAKMYFKTPEGIAHQRRNGLITAQRRIEKGEWNGIFYNTKPELAMKDILETILPKDMEIICQYPVWDIEHGCMVDFYIPDLNLVIEVDGKIVHSYPNGKEMDTVRTKELEEIGYKVLRFWEDEFNIESVMESIRDCLADYTMKIIKTETEIS